MIHRLKKYLKINYLFQNKLFYDNIELYTERITDDIKNKINFCKNKKKIENINQYENIIKKYLLKKHDFHYINHSRNYNNEDLENINKEQIKNYIYIENLLNNCHYNEKMIRNKIENKINENIVNNNYKNDIIIKSIVKDHIIF